MNWQTLVHEIQHGREVHWWDDRTSLRRARQLGLIAPEAKGGAYTLTAKGRDWIDGRLSIERKGNTAGMHQRATWLASLPQGLRL